MLRPTGIEGIGPTVLSMAGTLVLAATQTTPRRGLPRCVSLGIGCPPRTCDLWPW